VKAWIVRKVREGALASPSDPFHVADVCRSLGVSRRSLQYAFEDLTGMGVVQFLRNVRLNAVRRELHIPFGCPEEPIAAIAARWGFWHMPRFAGYYRALFGELPSETRRRQGPGTQHGLG
jgi:AraC family ethanolamine operon transcriptional activator